MSAKLITFQRNTLDLLTQAVKRGDVAEITLRYYEMNREQANEDGYVFPEETPDQQAAPPTSQGQNAESLLGTESQPTTPERTENPSQALAELSRITALLEDRQGLVQLIMQPIPRKDSPFNADFLMLAETNAGMLADRIRAYLKEQK